MAMDPPRARDQVVLDPYQTAARLHHRGAVLFFLQLSKILNVLGYQL